MRLDFQPWHVTAFKDLSIFERSAMHLLISCRDKNENENIFIQLLKSRPNNPWMHCGLRLYPVPLVDLKKG